MSAPVGFLILVAIGVLIWYFKLQEYRENREIRRLESMARMTDLIHPYEESKTNDNQESPPPNTSHEREDGPTGS